MRPFCRRLNGGFCVVPPVFRAYQRLNYVVPPICGSRRGRLRSERIGAAASCEKKAGAYSICD